jgi:hypothetical protein
MVSPRRRFRSLVEFHVGSYIYYRKHVQKSAWAPMHPVVVLGLLARFMFSTAAQAGKELASIARTFRSAGARSL